MLSPEDRAAVLDLLNDNRVEPTLPLFASLLYIALKGLIVEWKVHPRWVLLQTQHLIRLRAEDAGALEALTDTRVDAVIKRGMFH